MTPAGSLAEASQQRVATMGWTEFLSSVVSAAAAAGVVAVVFWRLLEKGLEAKLQQQQTELKAALDRQTEQYKSELNSEFARQLESYKTALALSTHKENTVFSRIDRQRSDTVQKLGGYVGTLRAELLDFSPKTPIGSKFPDDPAKDAVTWCVGLIASAKEPAMEAFKHSLLLPPALPVEIGGWYMVVSRDLQALLASLTAVILSPSFKAMSSQLEQRIALKAAKDAWTSAHPNIALASNNLENRLRLLLESVDRPAEAWSKLPVSTPAPLNQGQGPS